MNFRNTLSAVAAAGLVFAPLAAQAGTRASVPTSVASSIATAAPGTRSSKPVSKSNKLLGESGLLLLLGGAAAIGIGIAVLDDGGSRGSN